MDKKLESSMLNEPQRRGLSATFRTLEEMMYEIETVINSDGYRGTLVEIDNDVSPEAREEILKEDTAYKRENEPSFETVRP